MSPEEICQSEAFWEFVRKAEADIRENGHKGCPPPDRLTDPWDEAFASAYEAVKPHLARKRKRRLYAVPPGVTCRPTPIAADTATEAIMVFLNPPREIYGTPGVFDTAEYHAMKAAAVAEWQELTEGDEQPPPSPEKEGGDTSRDELAGKKRKRAVCPPGKKRTGGKSSWKVLLLLDYLVKRQKPGRDGKIPPSPTQREMQEAMTEMYGPTGWGQSCLSKLISARFGGMEALRECCQQGTAPTLLRRAIRTRNGDGSLNHDVAIPPELPSDE